MGGVLRPLARWAITSLLVASAVTVAVWIWPRYEAEPWTRDGHVRADVVRVTSDVGGLVTQVLVHDNQAVRRGQLLFVLDRPRFSAALEQAKANAVSAKATLDQARRVVQRDRALGDLVAVETREQNRVAIEIAAAALDQALAARNTAQINLDRTEVRATVDGTVTNLDLHPGDFFAAGAQALALVDADSVRVEGYFEETKLRRLRVGDKARILLIGDPEPLYGHVESVSAGIADDQATNTSNLLPAVQPTFSWVRLAERFPVRVHLDRIPAGLRLITGQTATVVILPASGRR